MMHPYHIIALLIALLLAETNTTSFDLSGIEITMDFVRTLFLNLLPWIFVMIILRAFFSFFSRGGRR